MKRSDRLIGMTNYFLNRPKQYVNLAYFMEKYKASKSSLSEDLDIIHDMFVQEGIGSLNRMSGANGGTAYYPYFRMKDSKEFIHHICEQLESPDRILPGGYVYMSDLLSDPETVREIGKAFVTAFQDKQIDAVVTVETKGIPIAYAIANYLNVPVIIIRRNLKVTEGSSVSINYVSGRSQRIQTMVLPKRHLKQGMHVCIVDDFMKAGGTINGMISLLAEFEATVSAIGVLAEVVDEENRVIDEYTSLIRLKNVQMDNNPLTAEIGSFVDEVAKDS